MYVCLLSLLSFHIDGPGDPLNLIILERCDGDFRCEFAPSARLLRRPPFARRPAYLAFVVPRTLPSFSRHLALLPRRCPIPLPSTLKHRITSSSDSLTYQGIYGISVDNASPSYYSGFASPDEFQQVLYSTSGLSQGDHQIVISNANSQNTAQYPNYIYVDVDFVAVTGTL